MRTENSIKNIISNYANEILLNIIRFISRIIFIRTIGQIYLGVNGLLSNILGLLALAELGIGMAIGFNLYKPLNEKDISKIKALMRFYKKSYQYIAILVAILGLALLPFLSFFIKDTNGIENLNYIYLIFLFNMVIGYLFTYKRTLIISDQKNYKIVPFIIGFNLIKTIGQIIVLFIFKNYFIYLLVESVIIIIENIVVNSYINKQYPYIKDLYDEFQLSKEENASISKSVKALLYHRLGEYFVYSTDNLLISKFIGIISVGIYSNYQLMIQMINKFIYVIAGQIKASFGNLIVTESSEKNLSVFKELDIIYYSLVCVSTVCFINLFNPFMLYCFGQAFVLSFDKVIFIVLNFYLFGMIDDINIVKGAAGLYEKDKWMPIIQALVNLIVSILLVYQVGLLGIFIGTTVSMIVPYAVRPRIVYKEIFKCNVSDFYKKFFKQLFIVTISVLLTLIVFHFYVISQPILNIAIRLIISVIISFSIIILFYYNDKSFKAVIRRIKFLFRKKLH